MGEYVWTTYTIGGEVKSPTVLEELFSFLESGWSDSLDCEDVLAAARAGKTVTVAGERNYGNDDDLDAFLTENGISFSAHYCAAAGVFGSGTRFWLPGMEKIEERDADDDGNTSITLKELQAMATAGSSIDDVIAHLAKADAIPPLVITPEALVEEKEDA